MEQIDDIIRRSINRGFILTLAVHVVTLLLAYLVHVSLARVMGAVEYGVYAYAFSWVSMIVLLGALGFDRVEQRFLPDYISRQEWPLARGTLVRSFQIPGTFALVLATGVGIVSWQLAGGDRHLVETFLWGSPLIPFLVWMRILQGGFIALKRPVLAQLPEGILQPAAVLAAIGMFAVWPVYTVNAPGVMLLLLIIAVVTAISTSAIFLYRVLPVEIKTARPTAFQMKTWLGVALPVFAISGMHLVMGYTDIIMIGIILDTTQSGIYSVASRVAALVAVPLAIVNTVLIPFISQLYHGARIPELQKTVSQAARLSGLFMLPVFAVLWVAAALVLSLFGEDFLAGDSAMKILMAGQLVNVLSGSVGFLMTLTGHQWRAAAIFSVGALLNVGLNLALIPLYGIEGAAVSTAISMVFWNLTLVIYVRTRVGINSTFFTFR